jgi:hypothetical protein
MLRSLVLTTALVTLAAGAANGADYSDAANNFRITIPENWTQTTPVSAVVNLKILSPRVEETHGVCTVIAKQVPQTRAVSQADIDADGEKTVDENFWLSHMRKAKEVKEVTAETHGVKMINGHKAYFVIVHLTGEVEGVGEVKAKTQQMIEAIPGQLFIVTCAAADAEPGYAQEESDFNIVFNSFAPLGDVPVAMLSSPGVSSLTMYTQPRFGGVCHIVTQDAPNVAIYGWRGTAASMSIAGSGAWEVCDGANFTGRCQTITTAMPTGPDGRAFAIASARHIKPILSQRAEPFDAREGVAATLEAFGR